MDSSAQVPALFSWSGGKDCALALHQLLDDEVPIAALITTVTDEYERISMHGVRRSLLQQQAKSLQLPLEEVVIPPNASNDTYEKVMGRAFSRYADRGIHKVIFGDIFLKDIRAYREDLVTPYNLEAIFPLWDEDTTQLASRFLGLGFSARIACVDTEQLDGSFAGRLYDEAFLADLPDDIDPCGENGEFHTFVFDGPIFEYPIPHMPGEVVLRDERFAFCDLIQT